MSEELNKKNIETLSPGKLVGWFVVAIEDCYEKRTEKRHKKQDAFRGEIIKRLCERDALRTRVAALEADNASLLEELSNSIASEIDNLSDEEVHRLSVESGFNTAEVMRRTKDALAKANVHFRDAAQMVKEDSMPLGYYLPEQPLQKTLRELAEREHTANPAAEAEKERKG